MPKYEELKKKQFQEIKTSGGMDYVQMNMGDQFLVRRDESFDYNESFLSEETDSQELFYDEYKKNHGEVYSGQKIASPAFTNKQELDIQDQNLSYWERKERKKKAKEQAKDWIIRLNKLNTNKDKDSKKIQPAYGLCLTTNYGTYAHDIMNSTVRYVAAENLKDKIIDDALKNAPKEKKELFEKYRSKIKALGPAIDCNPNENVKDDISATKLSYMEFTDYINRAINDPLGVIKEQVNDAILSYGQIPTKMLSKHAIPQKFDAVKQLRDKYKVVHELFTAKKGDDPAVDSLDDLKQDEMLRDNILFASELYMRLDVDLSYTLKHYGIQYDRAGFLDDDKPMMAAYRQTGEETLDAFKQIKNRPKNEKDTMVDNYWKSKISKEILSLDKDKEEKKEEKPEEKIQEKKVENKNDDDDEPDDNKVEIQQIKKEEEEEKEEKEARKSIMADNYNVVRTVNSITRDVQVLDDKKQSLIERVATSARKLGKALDDIDTEIATAKKVLLDSKALSALSNGVRRRLKWFINSRQQQQLVLMDRVAAYLNALRYLTGKNVLRANGSKILQEFSYEEKAKDFQEKDGFVDIDNDSFATREGSGKHILQINNDPMSFYAAEEKLTMKFLGNPEYERLERILDSENAEYNYYLLQLQDIDVMEMSFEEVCVALGNKPKIETTVIELAKAIGSFYKDIDNVYERMRKFRVYVLPENEMDLLVDKACKLRVKLNAINKLKKMEVNSDLQKVVSFGDYLKKIDKKGEYTDAKKDVLSQMKYKLVFDELEQYKYSKLMDHVANGTTVPDMFSIKELMELKEIDKKYNNGAQRFKRIKKWHEDKMRMHGILADKHRAEMIEYLEKEKELMKADYEGKSQTKEDIAKENQKYNEEKKKQTEEKVKQRKELKEQEKKAKEEKERLEKEEQEKKDKEAQEKNKDQDKDNKDDSAENKEEKKEENKVENKIEEKKEEKKEENKVENKEEKKEFIKAHKLPKKYTISAPEKKIPYTRKLNNDPGTDTWAHSLASIINYQAGKAVVEGKDLLTSNVKKNPAVFGEKRTMEADPFAYADIAFKYLPNTVMCKTTFDNLEYKSKEEFLSFIKTTINKNKAPLVLKRKQGFLTVYGIDARNQLICRRSTSDFVNDTYEEDPEIIFNNFLVNGEVSLYWFEKLPEKKEQIEKDYSVSITDKKVQRTDKNLIFDQSEEEKQAQTDGLRCDKKVGDQTVKQYLPKQLLDKKTADAQLKKLKTKQILTEPPIIKCKKKIEVTEPEVHPRYEYQGDTQYCWACALSGLINFKSGKSTSSMNEILHYEADIPKYEDTAFSSEIAYNDAVNEIKLMQTGVKVGNPAIFGDYMFGKLEDTAIRTAHIGKYYGKEELCKRRFKEILSKNLENGPVALLRKKHFVLIYKLDGDNIMVKNSARENPDEVKKDYYNVNDLFQNMNVGENVELVYLQDLKGKEKEVAEEFDAFSYDEKKRQFKRKLDENPINSTDSLLHKDGIETAKVDPEDVVIQSIYVPKQLSKTGNK